MVHSSLLRFCGISLSMGGLIVIFTQIWFYFDSASFFATYFDYTGWILIAFGIIGLYLVQYRNHVRIYVASFLLLTLSLLQWFGYKWFQTFAIPDLTRHAPEVLQSGLQSVVYGIHVSSYSLQISLFLFAVISLFIGILSKWALSLLLIGSAFAFNEVLEQTVPYSPIVPQIMIALALLWLGIDLLRYIHEESREHDKEKEWSSKKDSHFTKKEQDSDNRHRELGTS